MIHADALVKRYGPVPVLHGVSLSVQPGEVVGFLGENGAGKSTTMKVLTGAVAPSGGRASIGGKDVVADSLAARALVGYLPEEPPLYLDMTVGAYLDHVARLKGINAGGRRAAVLDAMESADVVQHDRRHIRKLSKGNRQRVGLAQAILGRPPVLVLDEPTSGLDPTQVGRFRDLIRSLGTRHAVLLSTHVLAEVEAMCSRVVVIHKGRTIAERSIDDLRRLGGSRLRLRVAGDAAALAERMRATGWATVHAVEDGSVLCSADDGRRAELAALAGDGLRELVEERRSLDEAFRDLVSTGPVAG
jgi:ABC-2 type transport system ATP-binding protein